MKTRMGNVMFNGVVLAVLLTVGAGYVEGDFIYIDKPGASLTYPMSIDGDTIVGRYDGQNGFIYKISEDSWTDFALKEGDTSYSTTPYSICDGYIVGHYAAGGQAYIGFVYNMATGNWIPLNFAYETIAFDVDGGYVVGNYGTPGDYDGFVYEIGTGNWTTLETPEGSVYSIGIDMDAGAGGTIAASGRVSGFYKSWLYDMSAREWTPFYGPNGESVMLLYSFDDDYITGAYGTNQQSFLYDRAADAWTLLDVDGAVGTYPQGNDAGTVVGFYSDPHGSVGRGFIYTFSQVPVVADFYLHGVTPALTLDNSAPTSATAKYKDSPSLRRTDFKEIGTWQYAVSSGMLLQSVEDLRVWVGLKNSDDQGTYFDIRAELLKNGTSIAYGETTNIQGVTRNPDKAKEVDINFGPITATQLNPWDVLSLRVLAKVTAVGGHSNAVGLRLYYDSVSRASRFKAGSGL